MSRTATPHRPRATSSRRRDTPPPSTGADEKAVLVGFLEYLRTSAASKLENGPEPAIRQPGVPSGTTVLGLVKHLSRVERFVFLGADVRSWPATFRATDDETVDSVLAEYRAAIEECNKIIAACTDLAATVPASAGTARSKRPRPSMRWALTHMIEETGRHAGHLDILRELIDGSTGR